MNWQVCHGLAFRPFDHVNFNGGDQELASFALAAATSDVVLDLATGFGRLCFSQLALGRRAFARIPNRSAVICASWAARSRVTYSIQRGSANGSA